MEEDATDRAPEDGFGEGENLVVIILVGVL